ncbi:MAG: ATP-binding protein [Candidatus Eisenbacteria bacterium]|uniref:ATP-binding protein n=1 Tax=Eiseniibacteriota bacterium TaxID=2212470 RepID=A0A948RTS1_UNCEI|nr:ATP-binding protein [Candidatus Eisenbacteria bacterium]MBU1947639.1 ATP-binding protein [Candidatus Eisenbacteria bacterium]MBU2690396.1 ATP-binding protein [Candidatus Eisenbacteria bacterium]
MLRREPYSRIWDELSAEKSLVFLAGPRQCGKTTLAQLIAERFTNSIYFNWDILTDKQKLIEDPFFFQNIVRSDDSKPLILLDEIHKYKDWKNYLKGAYDKFNDEYLFLVSGSGRLDLYQRGGDSLAGRYYLFHLWPLTLAELHSQNRTLAQFRKNPVQVCESHPSSFDSTWKRLAAYSGFPEPYLAAKMTTYRRWTNTYHRQLIREDIRDLTDIRNIEDLEILFSLLPSKVGSSLSIPSLVTDLKVSYNTVKNWLAILERFYLTFTITPWTNQITRAIHKDRKSYLFNYAQIEDEAAKFENMVALELHRAISNWNDMGYGDFGLHFIRTKEGREVDFLLSENRKPFLLIETKFGDDSPSLNLKRYQAALSVPAVQLVEKAKGFKRLTNAGYPLLIAPATWWIPNLPTV